MPLQLITPAPNRADVQFIAQCLLQFSAQASDSNLQRELGIFGTLFSQNINQLPGLEPFVGGTAQGRKQRAFQARELDVG